MKLLITCRRTAASAVLMSAFTTIAAQEPRRLAQPDSIPIDLATALLTSGGLGGDPQILVGSLPGWMTGRIYVPANGRILGSAVMGTTGLAIISTPDMPDVAIAAMRRELQTRGWKNPPAQPSFGGGFRPAVLAPGTETTRITLCGADQQVLSASATRRRGVSTDIVVRVVTPNPGGVCTPRQLPPGYVAPPWPTLFHPTGVVDANQLCGGDTPFGSSSNGAIVRTPMSAASLLDHYAKQLQDSGWRSPADSASVIGRTWTRTDSTGAPVELTITVASSPRDASCRTLNMNVHTLKKP